MKVWNLHSRCWYNLIEERAYTHQATAISHNDTSQNSARRYSAHTIDIPLRMVSSIAEMPLNRNESNILTSTPCNFSQMEESLNAWYTTISPRYVDLVSDFAGQEFFLLDGEALMQYIFKDPMLDLAGSKGGMHLISCLILTSGFQMLHFVYLVERFLLNLIRRRCFFSIIFFNGNFPDNFVECRFWERLCPQWESRNNIRKETRKKIGYSTHSHVIIGYHWIARISNIQLSWISIVYRKGLGLISHTV